MKNIIKLLFLFAITISLKAQNLSLQALSVQDSLYFESVQNDTTALKALTNRLGSRIEVKAHHRLGFIFFKSRQYSSAEKEFRVLKNSYGITGEGKEALYFLGRIASFKGNISEAKELYQRYLQEKKNGKYSEGSSYYLVLQKLKDKDQDALPSMRNHMEQFGDSSYGNHMQYQLVKYFRDKEDFSNAITEAMILLSRYPKSTYAADMQYQLGDFYYRAGRKNEAKKHYRSIIQKNPSNTEPAAIGQYLLAELYDKDGLNDSAKIEYLKVKKNNPGVLNWAILGEYSNAMCYYNEWALLSDSLMRDTLRIKTVTEKLQGFIDSYPTDKRTPRAMMTLAGVYDRIGEYEKSVDEFNRIISFDESLISNISPEVKQQELKAHRELVEKAHMSKAVALKQSLNRAEDALKEYEAVLAGNASNYDASLGKAMTLLHLQRKGEALILLQELISGETPVKEMSQMLINQFGSK